MSHVPLVEGFCTIATEFIPVHGKTDANTFFFRASHTRLSSITTSTSISPRPSSAFGRFVRTCGIITVTFPSFSMMILLRGGLIIKTKKSFQSTPTRIMPRIMNTRFCHFQSSTTITYPYFFCFALGTPFIRRKNDKRMSRTSYFFLYGDFVEGVHFFVSSKNLINFWYSTISLLAHAIHCFLLLWAYSDCLSESSGFFMVLFEVELLYLNFDK